MRQIVQVKRHFVQRYGRRRLRHRLVYRLIVGTDGYNRWCAHRYLVDGHFVRIN